MNEKIYNMMKEYVDKGISVIPCKRRYDEEKEIWTGKRPALNGWNKFGEELPSHDDLVEFSDVPDFSGFGIVMGELSNLCCVDIDTTDPGLIKKIKAIIPHTPLVILGAKGRGGKHIYRLHDGYNDFKMPSELKIKVKNGKETICDILLGNSQIVAPPSFHSSDKNLENVVMYEWESTELLGMPFDFIPVLENPQAVRDQIDMAVKGMSVTEMSKNFPTTIDLSNIGTKERAAEGHRTEDMISFAGLLVRNRVSIDKAVRDLLERDSLRNGGNPFFLSRDKGHLTSSPKYNAIKFYYEMFAHANKPKLRNVDELELPELNEEKIYVSSNEWGEIEREYAIAPLPEFNYDWIPNQDMKRYVEGACRLNKYAPQNMFFYMLCGFSSLVGNKIKIDPYDKSSSYVETMNIYVGCVAPSGGRKSEMANMALAPLKNLSKKIKQNEKIENSKAKRKARDMDVIIKRDIALRDKEILDTGIDSIYLDEMENAIDALRNKIPKIKNTSLMEIQATIQRLYEIVEENSKGIFIEVGEFGTKWSDIQAKGSEKEKEFWLRGWDGRASFEYRTKHQGENEIEELCLSVGFLAQFDIMEGIIDSVAKDINKRDGLLQRFLVFCDGDKKEAEFIDEAFSMPNSLNDLFESAYYIESSDEKLELSRGAYKTWEEFSVWRSKKEMHEHNNGNKALAISLSKYSGQFLRIAGLLEVIKNHGRRPDFIHEDSARSAWEIIKYAEANMRYLFELHSKRVHEEVVSMLKTSIIEDESSIRDIYRNHQRVFGNTAVECNRALESLKEKNIIKIYKEGRANRIKINPAL